MYELDLASLIDRCQYRRMSIASQAQRALCCQRGVALDQDQAVEFAALFKALSDPVRLRLLTLIAAASEEDGACVCDLTASFDLSQPTISHHTSVLVEAGLLSGRKAGRWTWWSLVPERLAQIRTLLGG